MNPVIKATLKLLANRDKRPAVKPAKFDNPENYFKALKAGEKPIGQHRFTGQGGHNGYI